MKIKDLIQAEDAQYAAILDDVLAAFQRPHNRKSRRDDIMVSGYVVGAYYRRRQRPRVVSLAEARKRKLLTAKADKLLKAGAR